MKAGAISNFSMIIIFLITLLSLQACKESDALSQASADSIQPADNQSDQANSNRDPLKLPLSNPRIIVFKSKRRLELYSQDRMVRSYRIGLGSNPVDDKVKQGDRRTPEGEFYVCIKNSKSTYYLSLGLSYPNQEDAERGLRDGLINRDTYNQIINAIRDGRTPPQNTALGGEIYIHGHGAGDDWTWGCVALDNSDVRELFEAVPKGTSVVIKP
jgi:murein L,D-transpeptidase YafK